MSRVLGILCGIGCLALFLVPTGPRPVNPQPSNDIVSRAFDTYEQLWRKHAEIVANKITAGEIKNEKEAWELLAAGQEPARKLAFDEIARTEKETFDKSGGWAATTHAQILRSYVK